MHKSMTNKLRTLKNARMKSKTTINWIKCENNKYENIIKRIIKRISEEKQN